MDYLKQYKLIQIKCLITCNHVLLGIRRILYNLHDYLTEAAYLKHSFYLKTLILVISLITRLYNIHIPAYVCWDETHFGKFTNKYIHGFFFNDVHPPFGKMLYAFIGFIFGYNGQYTFDKPGTEYFHNHYIILRMVSGVLGSILPLIVYSCVWKLSKCRTSSILATVFIIYDNGLVLLSRYILLDIPLIFFTMVSMTAMIIADNKKIYSRMWYLYLILSGSFMAFAVGTKFVGLANVLFIFLKNISIIHSNFIDENNNFIKTLKEVIIRLLFLALLPCLIYLLMYKIHFSLLYLSINGEESMYSSGFKAHFSNNLLNNVNMSKYIRYNDKISIRNMMLSGSYLHSHSHAYPEKYGPQQQQITGYLMLDMNSYWTVKHIDGNLTTEAIIKNGDKILLEHNNTKKFLHSHFHTAPYHKFHLQVTGYGQNGKGDNNDQWIIYSSNIQLGAPIEAFKTHFRLIHSNIGCHLVETEKTYPDWAFNQKQIVCALTKDEHPYGDWMIDSSNNKQDPLLSKEYKSSFISRFIETHLIMFKTNSLLGSNEESSKPWEWPIAKKGQIFCPGKNKTYLIGNPIIWWIIALNLPFMCIIFYINYSISLRNHQVMDKKYVAMGWFLIGWVINYLPFFFMKRILYYHHYFTSYIMSAMAAGCYCKIVIDITTQIICNRLKYNEIIITRIREYLMKTIFCFIIFVCIYSYMYFRKLVYGYNEKEINIQSMKWISSWNI